MIIQRFYNMFHVTYHVLIYRIPSLCLTKDFKETLKFISLVALNSDENSWYKKDNVLLIRNQIFMIILCNIAVIFLRLRDLSLSFSCASLYICRKVWGAFPFLNVPNKISAINNPIARDFGAVVRALCAFHKQHLRVILLISYCSVTFSEF